MHSHAGLCSIPVEGRCFHPIKTSNTVCSVKRDPHKDKDGRLRFPSDLSETSLSIATRDGEGHNEDDRFDPCREGAG